MKIKVTEKSIDEVMNIPEPKHVKPVYPSRALGLLQKVLAKKDMKAANVKFIADKSTLPDKDTPCLILMNHSSFIDLEIAATFFYPRPLSIVCTSDGFVGKEWLMRKIGCIPTRKFVNEFSLIKDITYALKTLKSSVLMYPEASYSFDGTATPLPAALGQFIARLRVPVVMVRTYGAFTRDPLYNGLRVRKVDVTVKVSLMLTPEDCAKKNADEINAILKENFTFDNFRWQYENSVRVTEDFRAEGLERVLYKCPVCHSEHDMKSSKTKVFCSSCGAEYELGETGRLEAVKGGASFDFVPDWYAWERSEVKKELESGQYRAEADVDIIAMVDFKSVYRVGKGHLVHDTDGFHLSGCGGKIDVHKSPLSSYGLYSDYYWYELGDMICIDAGKMLYYCFPTDGGMSVSKTRLAAEELYKLRY